MLLISQRTQCEASRSLDTSLPSRDITAETSLQASIARERFEAGLSELARAPKVLDLALAWQAALAAAGGGKDI